MESRFLDGHARLADAESHIGLEFDLDRRGFVRLVVGKYLEPGYGFISQRIGNLRLGGFHIGLELKLQGGAIKGDMDRFGDLSDRFKGFEIRLLNGQCTLHGSTLVGCRDFDLGFPIRDALSGRDLYDTFQRIIRVWDDGGGNVVGRCNGYCGIEVRSHGIGDVEGLLRQHHHLVIFHIFLVDFDGDGRDELIDGVLDLLEEFAVVRLIHNRVMHFRQGSRHVVRNRLVYILDGLDQIGERSFQVIG